MLVETLISVGGIALVVALAWWLGLRRPAAPLDALVARDLAELALAGFEAGDVALDETGAGAIVAGQDGRFALIKPHGAQWTVRALAEPAVTVESADLIVDGGDAMFGKVRLHLGAEAARAFAARMQAKAG